MATRKLEVVFTGDTKGLDRALGRAGGSADNLADRMKAAGKKIGGVGAGLTASVTAPLAGVGLAAGKLALDFDSSMTKIESLVGVNRKTVDAWRGDVLALAKDLPQSPKELADALFFVSSAGFRGKEALDVLKASAKAAAAGLGDTETVADAVTSAVNAYGSKTLGASKATDVLVATVREGKAAAEDLAPVFGRVIPVAESMGVSFEDVGGSLAALTRTGASAAEAATQTRAILSTIAKPSKGTADALSKMGTSVDEVRRSLKEKGFLATMMDLRQAAKENGVEFSSLFPNVRALGGFLSLTGSSARQNVGVFERMGQAVGSTDRAFERASDTAKNRLASALSSVQVAAIQLGDQVIPLLTPVIERAAKFVGDLGDKFSGLPKPVKLAIVAAGGLVAAIGPVLVALGASIAAIGVVAGALSGPLVAGVAVAVAAGVALARKWEDVREPIEEFGRAVVAMVKRDVLPALTDLARLVREVTEKVAWAFERFVLPVLQRVMPAILKVVSGAFDAIAGAAKILVGVLTLDFGEAWDGIKSLTSGALRALVGIVSAATAPIRAAASGLMGAAVAAIRGAFEAFLSAGRFVVGKLVDGVKGSAGAVAEAAGWLKNRVVEFVRGFAESYAQVGGFVLNRIVDGVKAAPGKLSDAAGWLKQRMVEFVQDRAGDFSNLGGWVVGKMVEGVKAAPGKLADAAEWLKDKLVGAVKKALGIASPSKVFAELGRWTMEGFVKGLDGDDALATVKGVFGGIEKLAAKLISSGALSIASLPAKAVGKLGGLLGLGGEPPEELKNSMGSAVSGSTVAILSMLAKRAGLTITSTTGGKHAPGSWHYQGRAVDSAGPPALMMAFARSMLAIAPRLKELFYDPLGVYVKNGQVLQGAIGGHGSHVHVAMAQGGIAPGGMVRVGELGPEDVYLPRGARVMQASDSTRSGPMIGEVHVHGSHLDADDLARSLAWQIATR